MGASDLSALAPLDGKREAVLQEGRPQGCGNEAVGAAAAGREEEDYQSHGSLPTPARHRPLPFLREGLQRTDALLLVFIFIKILLTDFPTVFLRQPCSFWV